MNVTRIFDLLDRLEAQYPKKRDILAAKEKGKWRYYSTEEYAEKARYFSYGLLAMNFKIGDKIATVSNNRPEWNFVDMGMTQVGAVHVPIYPTIGDDQYQHILEHSEARILIVSSSELYERLKPIADKIPSIEQVYSFDKLPDVPHWTSICELGRQQEDYKIRGTLINRKNEISKDDLATIIYTSGTTGVPKGVMLTHWSFVYQVHEIARLIDLDHRAKALSFLPLCHVLERIGGYVYQFKAFSIHYAESIETIGQDAKDIHPEIMITVPRLLEKVYDRILQAGKDLEGWKRRMFHWAVELGLKYEIKGKSLKYMRDLAVANSLIFSKWRAALGGRIKYIIVGGAALQPRLARAFWAAGIPVFEGYGLTETAPVIAVNHPHKNSTCFGTVGPLLGEGQVRIADDGEILFKGPNLMLGYYKQPELTAEAIDADGWFHTGDIGEFVEDRYLKITDRKKEMFKTSGGKYVAPQVIENKFKESFFIEQLMVVGENQKFVGALISPNMAFLHDWCHRHNILFRENRELIDNPQVVARYQEEVDKYNATLGKVQKIKRFKLVCEEWSTESGELSPTLKLRRKFVKQKYAKRLEEIYAEN